MRYRPKTTGTISQTPSGQLAEARKLLTGAVRRLLPNPVVSIEAPTFVETVVTREEETLRVHLISRVSPPTATPPKNRPYALPSLAEDVPLYRARIRCRQPIADAAALEESTILARSGERDLSATIESIHETIVLKLR